jgi:exonuclease III
LSGPSFRPDSSFTWWKYRGSQHDAQRYGYRFEEEGPSLIDHQYVGHERYQAEDGVLISKESETEQRLQIYLVSPPV